MKLLLSISEIETESLLHKMCPTVSSNLIFGYALYLMEMEDNVRPYFEACPLKRTANTMQMLGEVLNLVLPRTSTMPSTDNAKLRKVREAGMYAVEMAKKI